MVWDLICGTSRSYKTKTGNVTRAGISAILPNWCCLLSILQCSLHTREYLSKFWNVKFFMKHLQKYQYENRVDVKTFTVITTRFPNPLFCRMHSLAVFGLVKHGWQVHLRGCYVTTAVPLFGYFGYGISNMFHEPNVFSIIFWGSGEIFYVFSVVFQASTGKELRRKKSRKKIPGPEIWC